jgi:hypothetical protein
MGIRKVSRFSALHLGVPHGTGPAAAALLRRGNELRGELLLRTFALIAACAPSRPGQRGPLLVPSPVPGRVLGGHERHDGRRLVAVDDGQLFSHCVTGQKSIDSRHLAAALVVGYLDGAVCLPVVPGPGVIERGGEQRRVISGRLFSGRFAVGHPRMLA